MAALLDRYLGFFRRSSYHRPDRLVLINGLAEQAESWFCNQREWQRHFDVKMPDFLVYQGAAIQRRIEEDLPISVEYLTDQLDLYLESFVQNPPYHLVASSLGCQIAIEYTIRHPERVGRIVLLCPSGFGGEEKLPVVEGVRRNDLTGLVGSVFYDRRHVQPAMINHLQRQFTDKQWKKAILRTVRGTYAHSVRDKLPLVRHRVLLVCGEEDRIIDSQIARDAVRGLSNYEVVTLPQCGHAPQIEASRHVNRLVREFLQARTPAASAEAASPTPALETRSLEAEPSYA